MENSFRFIPESKLLRGLKKAVRDFMIGGGAFLLVMWLALFGFPANNASAETIGDYTVETSGTTCTITGYSGSGDITIPDTLGAYTVTAIGNEAFYGCNGLTSVTIPESVTSIGVGPFCCCYDLASINVVSSNANYSSENGVLFNNAKTELINYPGGMTGSYTIPATVTAIADEAFSSCQLEEIIIPDGVSTIGATAFYYCTGLTAVSIPGSVTSIGADAFNNCSELNSITLGTGIQTIGNNAFNYCSKLTSITIPASITSIGVEVFEQCAKLTSINVASENSDYASENGVLFNKAKTELIACPGGKTGQYIIPTGVTTIGENAFEACFGLTGVIMPDSVTLIKTYAFNSCWALRSLTLGNSILTIESGAFACTGLTSVTIPSSVTSIGDGVVGGSSVAKVYFCGNMPVFGYQPFGNPAGVTVYIPKGNTTYASWSDYTKQEYSYGCSNFKGAQKKSNGTIRLIATIDSLDPSAVGFVYSTTDVTPTISEGATPLSTTTVYTSIIANGSTKDAASLGGTYIVAIPVSGITDPIYVRSFAMVDGTTKYGAVFTVTPSSLPLP